MRIDQRLLCHDKTTSEGVDLPNKGPGMAGLYGRANPEKGAAVTFSSARLPTVSAPFSTSPFPSRTLTLGSHVLTISRTFSP